QRHLQPISQHDPEPALSISLRRSFGRFLERQLGFGKLFGRFFRKWLWQLLTNVFSLALPAVSNASSSERRLTVFELRLQRTSPVLHSFNLTAAGISAIARFGYSEPTLGVDHREDVMHRQTSDENSSARGS